MKKRIIRATSLVAAAVLIACLGLVFAVIYARTDDISMSQLTAQMSFAENGIETGGERYLKNLNAGDYRVTWIDANGTVLYDSKAAAASMENHAERAEVRAALDTGKGESARYSSTLAQRTFYMAKRLTDGTVLRVSVTRDTALSMVAGMLPPMLGILAAAVLFSSLLAGSIARRIVKPLNELDLEKPLENDAYEELSPLLKRIESQHAQIAEQLNMLKRSRDEFALITDSMNEGLVLLNDSGEIISINPAAMRCFGADASSEGQNFLTVNRQSEITSAIQRAAENGHTQTHFSRAGREYRMDINRIAQNDRLIGTAILAYDVTGEVYAERNRREFTANVSHELKTPLQTIMGSAELMENGLVKSEDTPLFISRIRSESARLLTLIEDIIRLSQLDEGGEMPGEEVDLRKLADETMQALGPAAAKKGVELSATGKCAPINGVKRLMQEIAFNLCDNAIKYNIEGGKVAIEISETDKDATLCVSDTGIGIPPEHQDRIFERFYRVDKSHSKKTGGTGLGLSIVKHAAQYMHADISLESKVGKGTRISVTFPK